MLCNSGGYPNTTAQKLCPSSLHLQVPKSSTTGEDWGPHAHVSLYSTFLLTRGQSPAHIKHTTSITVSRPLNAGGRGSLKRWSVIHTGAHPAHILCADDGGLSV